MRSFRAFAVITALFLSGTAYAGLPAWTISESSGTVTVVKGGISQIASRGGSLSVGDLVSTSVNGRAVLVRGQEYLIVSPGSRVRIADPAASGGFTQIIQDFGNAIFRIKKKSTPHFAVETPYLAAVVKGTTFSVTVTATGTAVQVTEGLVQVSTNDGGASHLVKPGDIGLVEAGNPLRLSIKGKEAQIIDSPNPPATQAAPATTIAAAATEAFADAAAAAPPAVDQATDKQLVVIAPTVTASLFDSVIGAPVTEGAVNLDRVSGGLVQGNSMLAGERPVVVSQMPVEVASSAASSPVALPVDVSASVIVETPPVAAPVSQGAVEVAQPVASSASAPPVDVSAGVIVETPPVLTAAPTPPAADTTPVQVAVIDVDPVLIALPPTAAPLPPTTDMPPPAIDPTPSAPGRAVPPVTTQLPGALTTPANPGTSAGVGSGSPPQPTPPLVELPVILTVPTSPAPTNAPGGSGSGNPPSPPRQLPQLPSILTNFINIIVPIINDLTSDAQNGNGQNGNSQNGNGQNGNGQNRGRP